MSLLDFRTTILVVAKVGKKAWSKLLPPIGGGKLVANRYSKANHGARDRN